MGTIRKRGDYQFQAQVRRAGYPPQSKTFDTRKDAERWVRAIEREMDTGTFIPRSEAERTTIASLAERYLEVRASKMKGKRQEEQRVSVISDKFGKYHLSAITPAMITDWMKVLGKTRSPQTVQHYAATLGRLYKAAAMDFGIPLPLGNPLTGVRMPEVRNERDRILDADETKRLFESLDKSRGQHLKPIVEIALETAMRRGEILGLTWNYIDLNEQLAFLPDTKNGDSRTVPLSKRAVVVLKGLTRNISGKVFVTSATAVTEGFQRAVLRAEINDFRFHDLRHCAISALAKKLSILELAKMAGHRSSRSVMRYYEQDNADLVRKVG
jgi:integrase